MGVWRRKVKRKELAGDVTIGNECVHERGLIPRKTFCFGNSLSDSGREVGGVSLTPESAPGPVRGCPGKLTFHLTVHL